MADGRISKTAIAAQAGMSGFNGADELLAPEESNDGKPCYFFKLPPELRNTIYELALIPDRPIKICTYKGCDAARQPALTQTCRQVRSESLSIFYQCNTFPFESDCRYTMENQLKFDFIESHIPELRNIEIASRWQRGYFTLKVGETSGLGEWIGGALTKNERWWAQKGAWCFANPGTLAVGLSYFSACKPRTTSGAIAMDAAVLEMLIVKLELPDMPVRNFRRLARNDRLGEES